MDRPRKTDLHEVGARLRKLTYEEIEKELIGLNLDGDSLIEMENHPSRKVADSAVSLLNRRSDGPTLTVDAILSDRFTHRDAKIQATNLLARRGRASPDAMRAYLHLLGDRSAEVVGSALFGVVFFQDKGQLQVLERRRDALPVGTKTREMLDQAIRALQQANPFLFSPGFHDVADVWGLDRKRFANSVGPL